MSEMREIKGKKKNEGATPKNVLLVSLVNINLIKKMKILKNILNFILFNTNYTLNIFLLIFKTIVETRERKRKTKKQQKKVS